MVSAQHIVSQDTVWVSMTLCKIYVPAHIAIITGVLLHKSTLDVRWGMLSTRLGCNSSNGAMTCHCLLHRIKAAIRASKHLRICKTWISRPDGALSLPSLLTVASSRRPSARLAHAHPLRSAAFLKMLQRWCVRVITLWQCCRDSA